MRRARRLAIVTGAVLFVGAVALVLRTLNAGGLFAEVSSIACKSPMDVRGVAGPEDMLYDAPDNAVFISSTDWRARTTYPSAKDGIYLYRPGKDGAAFRLSGTPADFHPHGISLFRDADGTLTLMAVNHPAHGNSAIDIFDVTGLSSSGVALRERESIGGDLLISPNDVVAVDKNRFYASNDRTSKTAFGKWLEAWLILPRANVVYFDGSTFRIVADGLHFANGINKSADGLHIYVAETTGREIQTYARNAFSGELTYVNSLPIASGLDNVDVEADGRLLVAGHPKLFAFLAYASDPSKPSPSQIFKVSVDPQGLPREAMLVFSGNEIAAASVGILARDRLLIGSVLDPKILSCALTT